MPHIKPDLLEPFVSEIFFKAGLSREESGGIGKCLVGANLAGHDSHGVARVPRYVMWKRDGAFLPDRKVKRVVDTPVLAILDGQFGFGQTVAPQAVDIGIEKCKQMGLSAIGLRNSGHVGRVGDWAERAASAGLVSIHFVNVNGSVLVAPFGGVERRFSTAPYCIGIPRPGADPLILDFATSLVAEGKVLVASQGGKKIPHDALVRPDGQVSDDPHVLYGDYGTKDWRNPDGGPGALRAFGEHKGSGLALMCELLGGALSGNGGATPGHRWAQGMFSFYIDPKVVDPENFFPAEVTRFLGYVKAAKPVKAGGEVLAPGEPEARSRAERRQNGIPISDDTWAAILATARQVGVAEAHIQAVAAV